MPDERAPQGAESEHGYQVVISLALDDEQVTTREEAEAVAHRLFMSVFDADEVSAGGHEVEPL